MFTSYFNHSADEGLKSAAFMVENTIDPTTSFSQDPSTSPLARAFNTNVGFFEWLDQPGNERRLRRFGAAMQSGNSLTAPDLLIGGASLCLSLW